MWGFSVGAAVPSRWSNRMTQFFSPYTRQVSLVLGFLLLALALGAFTPLGRRLVPSLLGGRMPGLPVTSHTPDRTPPLRGEAARDYLQQQGLYERVNASLQAARYQITPVAQSPLPGGGAAHEAQNPAQGLRAYFTPQGVTVTGDSERTAWQSGLQLRAVGRGGQWQEVSRAEVSANGTRASLRRTLSGQPTAPLEEWYENRADGLEQGFTLGARPEGTGAEVELELAVTGTLAAQAAGSGVELRGAGAHLRYDGLKSWDATGRELATRLAVEGQRVRLLVADAGAVYPVTIDPTITQVKQITASDGAASDQFGLAVAVDGDTLVVGAYADDVGANRQSRVGLHLQPQSGRRQQLGAGHTTHRQRRGGG
jgi:hypothetical protein